MVSVFDLQENLHPLLVVQVLCHRVGEFWIHPAKATRAQI